MKTIDDLTTEELAEWYTALCLFNRLSADLSLGEGWECVRVVDAEGDGNFILDLRDELLAAYAERAK